MFVMVSRPICSAAALISAFALREARLNKCHFILQKIFSYSLLAVSYYKVVVKLLKTIENTRQKSLNCQTEYDTLLVLLFKFHFRINFNFQKIS